MKLICIFLTSFILFGCVKIKMPDNLVSDTVNAGKGLYKDLTKSDTTETIAEVPNNAIIFTNNYVGRDNQTINEVKSSCLLDLENQAKKKLTLEKVNYKIVENKVTQRDTLTIATCKIAVL